VKALLVYSEMKWVDKRS